jgi:hypothetical protein
MKQANAALQRLAHSTTNKGYSQASPLQALGGQRVGHNFATTQERPPLLVAVND